MQKSERVTEISIKVTRSYFSCSPCIINIIITFGYIRLLQTTSKEDVLMSRKNTRNSSSSSPCMLAGSSSILYTLPPAQYSIIRIFARPWLYHQQRKSFTAINRKRKRMHNIQNLTTISAIVYRLHITTIINVNNKYIKFTNH